jgi:hypothetical protein
MKEAEMPEEIPEFDPVQEEVDPVQAESEEEAGGLPEREEEPEKKEPQPVPYDRFKEVWEERQFARHEADQLRQQNLEIQRQVMAAAMQAQRQQIAPPKAKTREEQELAELLQPFINDAIKPLEQDYQRKSAMLDQIVADTEARRAEDYVKSNVPDFNDLAPDLQSWLNNQPPGYRNFITSHPDNVVLACNMIRATRAVGGKQVAAQVRNDLKSRSKSESGVSPSQSGKNQNIDWLNLTDEEFAKYDAQIRSRSSKF